MKILGFSKETYNKEQLDILSDDYLYYEAMADDTVILLEDIKDFQDYINAVINHSDEYWWYFIKNE